MDLKWQMVMLSVRVHKFEQKAGRKIDFDKKESARFNKKKVRCYKCLQRGHFTRECKAKGGNDKQRYSSFKILEIGKKEEDSKALITVDTLVDWIEHDGQSDGVLEKFYAHESLTFNNTVACEVISKGKEDIVLNKDSWGITNSNMVPYVPLYKAQSPVSRPIYDLAGPQQFWYSQGSNFYVPGNYTYMPNALQSQATMNPQAFNIMTPQDSSWNMETRASSHLTQYRDQSGNTLRVSQSKIHNEKLVQTLLKGHSTLSLKDSLSGDCDVEKNGCAGSLKANLQHIEALSTTKARYMTFTDAWKKEILLKDS
ncbi:ribonuclease H-like domain-containing protein [Tanacetum coccineum]